MDIEYFLNRCEKEYIKKRLERQVDHSAFRFGGKKLLSIYIENIEWIFVILKWILKFTFLFEFGKRNTINYEVNNTEFIFNDLPQEFDGYKILHLSDIHIDGIFDGGKKLYSILDKLDYDICVLTGDYRFHTYGDYDLVIDRIKELKSHIKTDIYAILGNHDFIEFVPDFEKIGIRCLLNESVEIKKGDNKISILGSDDYHFYEVNYFEKLVKNKNVADFKILLLHSPECIEEAEKLGIRFYLSGHTHGGQICLPGEIAILSNSSAKRKFNNGKWTYKNIKGYTSKGVGSSGLAVRFFCNPEVVIHTLKKY